MPLKIQKYLLYDYVDIIDENYTQAELYNVLSRHSLHINENGNIVSEYGGRFNLQPLHIDSPCKDILLCRTADNPMLQFLGIRLYDDICKEYDDAMYIIEQILKFHMWDVVDIIANMEDIIHSVQYDIDDWNTYCSCEEHLGWYLYGCSSIEKFRDYIDWTNFLTDTGELGVWIGDERTIVNSDSVYGGIDTYKTDEKINDLCIKYGWSRDMQVPPRSIYENSILDFIRGE